MLGRWLGRGLGGYVAKIEWPPDLVLVGRIGLELGGGVAADEFKNAVFGAAGVN